MTVIYNGVVVNLGESFEGYVLVEGERIVEVGRGRVEQQVLHRASTKIDAKGGYIMAGVIDDQVHFRDPGLTYKADIKSESKAAVAGGVTSFMDMPNTVPQTVSGEQWERKMERAAEVSMANYAFYLGATNDNLGEITRINRRFSPGVKVFMGSSTGGMLVDRREKLEAIFAECPVLVATHCEDEKIVQQNIKAFGPDAVIENHPMIRSAEACYRSSAEAVDIAAKYGTRLHVLHLSTARELSLFETKPMVGEKKITNEVCVHHLWFFDEHYKKYGNRIKWNPAIKTKEDRDALRDGLLSGRVDIVATDHAPHTIEEKDRPYTEAPSGGPMVQHSLVAMLEIFSPQDVSRFMSHRVAECMGVVGRGALIEGYYADIVVVGKEDPWEVSTNNILYKCGWSPMEGTKFSHKVNHTIINGKVVYSDGEFDESFRGSALEFA